MLELKAKKNSLSMLRRSSIGGLTIHMIDQSRYEVTGHMKNGITCGKWQMLGIPCTHAMVVFKELRYQHCYAWVSSYFTMETYRSTYKEVVFPMPVQLNTKNQMKSWLFCHH
uniref:SWIM-type domain-containing protein n=1 Tax=Lactuca sativa TaxID=4236 RepID=A0A9R1W3V1_LACSA|nr:hypothetical protein LSAT_V11C300135440 [Lactuca sativa]